MTRLIQEVATLMML